MRIFLIEHTDVNGVGCFRAKLAAELHCVSHVHVVSGAVRAYKYRVKVFRKCGREICVIQRISGDVNLFALCFDNYAYRFSVTVISLYTCYFNAVACPYRTRFKQNVVVLFVTP